MNKLSKPGCWWPRFGERILRANLGGERSARCARSGFRQRARTPAKRLKLRLIGAWVELGAFPAWLKPCPTQNYRRGCWLGFLVVGGVYRDASQTRDYCVAKNATLLPPHHAKTGRVGDPGRAARPDPSLRKKRLLGMTSGNGESPATRRFHFAGMTREKRFRPGGQIPLRLSFDSSSLSLGLAQGRLLKPYPPTSFSLEMQAQFRIASVIQS